MQTPWPRNHDSSKYVIYAVINFSGKRAHCRDYLFASNTHLSYGRDDYPISTRTRHKVAECYILFPITPRPRHAHRIGAAPLCYKWQHRMQADCEDLRAGSASHVAASGSALLQQARTAAGTMYNYLDDGRAPPPNNDKPWMVASKA